VNPVIKICGITRVEDAKAALAAGASYIGLIFVDSSPRRVDDHTAMTIIKAVKGRARIVGVFKDSSKKFILKKVSNLQLDMVQCHGDESPEFLDSLGVPSIKAIELKKGFKWDGPVSYAGSVEYILFDRPKGEDLPGWFDRAVKKMRSAPKNLPPFFFAGGLTPDNVAEVVRETKPYAVDVASGIEKEPGIKDASKLKSFCRAVKEEAGKCAP
jgi:phosphoribosylanthranilate isomerase